MSAWVAVVELLLARAAASPLAAQLLSVVVPRLALLLALESASAQVAAWE